MKIAVVVMLSVLSISCRKGGEVVVEASGQMGDAMREGIAERQRVKRAARNAEAKAQTEAKEAKAKAGAWDPGTQSLPPGMKKSAN